MDDSVLTTIEKIERSKDLTDQFLGDEEPLPEDKAVTILFIGMGNLPKDNFDKKIRKNKTIHQIRLFLKQRYGLDQKDS